MLVLLWINFLLTLSHCVFTYIFKINQNGNVTLQIRFCEKVTHIRLFSRMCTKRNVRWIPCFFSFATTRRPCLIILCLWLVVDAILAFRSAFLCSGERRKFSRGGFIQHTVIICIWCALFVTSQFDAIFMFPNQRFGEVCWHNMRILLHLLPLFYVSFNINYQRSREDMGGK